MGGCVWGALLTNGLRRDAQVCGMATVFYVCVCVLHLCPQLDVMQLQQHVGQYQRAGDMEKD